MLLLDENIDARTRLPLVNAGIHFKQIGIEISMAGTSDEDIIRWLHQQKQVTFFTFDNNFFNARLRHANYCLVWLHVAAQEQALYI